MVVAFFRSTGVKLIVCGTVQNLRMSSLDLWKHHSLWGLDSASKWVAHMCGWVSQAAEPGGGSLHYAVGMNLR